MKKLLTILLVLVSFSSFAQFEAGEYVNTDTVKLNNTPLLLDAFKSGSLGEAGNIFYSTGASSQPASGTVNQVIGGNTLTSSYLPYWDGAKLANTIASNEAQGIVITKESGDVYFKAKSGVGSSMYGTDINAAYIKSNNNLMWYAENNINNLYRKTTRTSTRTRRFRIDILF